IPVGATLIAGRDADLLIGRVTAAGGVFALLTPIVVGWLSDRTVTRWGRRRPWMVAGTVLNIIGLGLLALSASQLTFIAAYLLVQLSNNAAGGHYLYRRLSGRAHRPVRDPSRPAWRLALAHCRGLRGERSCHRARGAAASGIDGLLPGVPVQRLLLDVRHPRIGDAGHLLD